MDKNKERILINGQDETEDILSCLPSGKKYEVVFMNDPKKIYTYGNYKISFVQNELNNVLSQKVINYFKDVADIISVKSDDGSKILARQYNKINFVREDTVLAKYLSAKAADKILTVCILGLKPSP